MSAEVLFVCWGNICRSPMAERVALGWAGKERLGPVSFTSAGVSSEETGHAMDPRAARTLRAAGYDPDGHVAHQVTRQEVREADLVIGMEDIHLERIRRAVPEAANLYLLTNFDPDAVPGSQVPDPWYGPESGFEETLASIEAAMPELMRRVRELL